MVWVREINVRGPQGPSGGIDPNDPVMLESVRDAIDDQLRRENVMRAYPETPIVRTNLTSIPMHFDYTLLSDPVGDLVTETVEGTWYSGGERRADIPLLTAEGKIASDQIPDWVASLSDIPEIPVIPPPAQATIERVVNPALPILAARVAVARTNDAPVAGVIAGSSTSAYRPGYIGALTKDLQSVYPVADPTVPQWSTSAEFTHRTQAGLHVYSAAQGATRSDDYLTDEESDRIAQLAPAFIMHMVVNDYADQTDPAVYAANHVSRLAYFDSVLPAPCQHILAFPYARMAFDAHTYAWEEYGAALEQVAAGRPDTVFVNLNDAYVANDVTSSGSDPLGLISGDNIHQTPAGYAFMRALFAAFFLA